MNAPRDKRVAGGERRFTRRHREHFILLPGCHCGIPTLAIPWDDVCAGCGGAVRIHGRVESTRR